MNRATSSTGWARNPTMISPDLYPVQASSYKLGWTWNPITGCLNGCPYCYARRLANGRLKQMYLANKDFYIPEGHESNMRGRNGILVPEVDPFYPRFWPERILGFRLKHDHNKDSKGIFVCDMGELFGDWIPQEWQQLIFNTIKACPQHRFYLLTKQPQNLTKFSPFPKNCWVGVTATDYAKFLEACNYLEYPLEAKVKYLSLEPLLGWENNWTQSYTVNSLKRAHIKWLIIGAQTKPYKPPKIEWVQEIVEAADRAGVPVFLKDNLRPLIRGNEDIVENTPLINKNFSWRQEMPG